MPTQRKATGDASSSSPPPPSASAAGPTVVVKAEPRVLSSVLSDAVFASSAFASGLFWLNSKTNFAYQREAALGFLLLGVPASLGSVRFAALGINLIPKLHDLFTLYATYTSIPILSLLVHALRHDTASSLTPSSTSSLSSSTVHTSSCALLVASAVIAGLFFRTRKRSTFVAVSKLIVNLAANVSLLYDGYMFMRRGGVSNHDGGLWLMVGATVIVLSGLVVGGGERAWKVDAFHYGMAFAMFALSRGLKLLNNLQ